MPPQCFLDHELIWRKYERFESLMLATPSQSPTIIKVQSFMRAIVEDLETMILSFLEVNRPYENFTAEPQQQLMLKA